MRWSQRDEIEKIIVPHVRYKLRLRAYKRKESGRHCHNYGGTRGMKKILLAVVLVLAVAGCDHAKRAKGYELNECMSFAEPIIQEGLTSYNFQSNELRLNAVTSGLIGACQKLHGKSYWKDKISIPPLKTLKPSCQEARIFIQTRGPSEQDAEWLKDCPPEPPEVIYSCSSHYSERSCQTEAAQQMFVKHGLLTQADDRFVQVFVGGQWVDAYTSELGLCGPYLAQPYIDELTEVFKDIHREYIE